MTQSAQVALLCRSLAQAESLQCHIHQSSFSVLSRGWLRRHKQHGKSHVKKRAQKSPFFRWGQKEDPRKHHGEAVQANRYPTQWILVFIAS